MLRNSIALRALILACAAGLAGCATTSAAPDPAVEAFVADKPAELQPLYRQLASEGTRNRVLNNMHICVKAMEIGFDDLAERACDDALRNIEAVYAQSESAEKARSLWHEEGEKDFKGEPYERAMVYYYRGLLYLFENDYDNARASFRGGLIQDSLAEDEEYAQDFALLSFMHGWASQCVGDAEHARESFSEVSARHASFGAPAPEANLLILAETGRGPVKFSAGESNQELHFRPGDETPDRAVRVSVGDQPVDAFAVEDLFFQASTRGGRPVDAILEGKAHFKDQVSTAGDIATQAGLGTLLAGSAYQSPEVQLVGAGIAAIGFMAKMASSAMKPAADTRMWTTLPAAVHVATAKAAAGPVEVATRFVDGDGNELDPLSDSGPVTQGATGCSVVWLRSGAAEGGVAARRSVGMTLAQVRR